MEMLNNKESIHKKLQGLLPDYVSNRISAEDKKYFEDNLSDFPAILKEVVDLKMVFEKVEAMKINRDIAQRTRNLSIKVNNRLRRESQGEKRFRIISKYIIPSLGLVAIVFFIITGNINFDFLGNENQQNQFTSIENFVDFSNAEVNAIISSNVNEPDYLAISSESSINFDEEQVYQIISMDSDLIEEAYNNFEIELYADNDNLYNDFEACCKTLANSEFDVLYQLNDLFEDDIQYLLEEIENADFNS